jgi:hypothetical protein
MNAATQERRDLHNVSIDFAAASEGLCGFTHMPSGRVCRLPYWHPGRATCILDHPVLRQEKPGNCCDRLSRDTPTRRIPAETPHRAPDAPSPITFGMRSQRNLRLVRVGSPAKAPHEDHLRRLLRPGLTDTRAMLETSRSVSFAQPVRNVSSATQRRCFRLDHGVDYHGGLVASPICGRVAGRK